MCLFHKRACYLVHVTITMNYKKDSIRDCWIKSNYGLDSQANRLAWSLSTHGPNINSLIILSQNNSLDIPYLEVLSLEQFLRYLIPNSYARLIIQHLYVSITFRSTLVVLMPPYESYSYRLEYNTKHNIIWSVHVVRSSNPTCIGYARDGLTHFMFISLARNNKINLVVWWFYYNDYGLLINMIFR